MTQRVLGRASVVALTWLVSGGLAAACRGELVPMEVGLVDAAPDRRSRTEVDAGEPYPPEPEPRCAPIDATKFPYATALVSPGACSIDDLEALSAFFKSKVDDNDDVLISEWSKAVSAGCAACVFSNGAGPTWTPLLSKGDKLESVNVGGCVEVVSGTEECGRRYQQMTDCRLEACLDGWCRGSEPFDACYGSGKGVPTRCKDAQAAMQAACGADLIAYEAACKGTSWTFEGPIRVQCITGGVEAADAGDGGS